MVPARAGSSPCTYEPVEPALRVVEVAAGEEGSEGENERDDEPIEVGASRLELLRDKDFAELTEDELLRVRDLIGANCADATAPALATDADATRSGRASTCAG